MMFIPLVVLIILVLISKENMQQYFSKDILDKLAVGGRTLDKTTRNGLFFITLILFIFALGRPVTNEKEQSLQQNLIPIVIALDVSKSMLATDIYPNRISLAKEKLKHIIQIAQNSTVGILLFAKDSFILSPVTEDFVSLKYIVEKLDTNLDFTNGSNIYATLEATSYMLEEFKVKNLIILSDGGNDNKYDKELEFAKENGIEIYSIGLATKKGAPIPQKNGYLTNKDGNIVSVKLNESIKSLSLKSGGGYIDFTINKNDVEAIIQRINKQSKKEKLTTQKVKIYTELFYYPLGLALFVLLIALSSFPTIKLRKNKTTQNSIKSLMLLALFSIVPVNSEAEIFEFKNIEKANQLYKDKQYAESSNEFRKVSTSPQSLYNLANSLYKDKKYKEAIETYSKVITENKELESKKLHNIGNSYVNTKNLEKAKEFYEKSLKIKDDKQTKENLEMVKKELEKQKKKKENKDEDGTSEKNKDNKDKKKNDKDKKDKKNNKDGNKKNNKDKKKQEDKKNKNKDKKEKKQNEDGKSEKKSDKKNNKDKNDAKGKGQSKQVKKENISDMEEKKWMDMLKQEKTPILLRKVETKKESNSDESQPW